MSETTPLTMQRVKDVMSDHNVVLSDAEKFPDVAGANLNGHDVTFAVLNSELIIRLDMPTGQATAEKDPTWFMVANSFNTVSSEAKAAVVDRTEQLLIRVESEFDCGAGVTDEQLALFVQSGVNSALGSVAVLQGMHKDISS